MLFVICEQHGGDTAPHLCRCAATRVWKREAVPGTLRFVDLDGFYLMGYVCSDCLNALEGVGLTEFTARHNGDSESAYEDPELDKFVDLIDFQPACKHCVRELANCKPPPGTMRS